MAKQVKIIDEDGILTPDGYRASKEGVEIPAAIGRQAGIGIPVFMSQNLYNEHLPDIATFQEGVTTKEKNLKATLQVLRHVTEKETEPLVTFDTVVPTTSGVRHEVKAKDFKVAAMLAPNIDEPFIIMALYEEIADVIGH